MRQDVRPRGVEAGDGEPNRQPQRLTDWLGEHQRCLDTCKPCQDGWQETPPAIRGSYLDLLHQLSVSESPEQVHRDDLPHDLEALTERHREHRKLRRWASQQLSELRRLPRRVRVDKVRGARSRFRSRPLAELLLQEARSVVRNEPWEAESFARLVPLVLDWAITDPQRTWANPLCALAEAHRANALRVAGELPAAAEVFELLRHALAIRPVADPQVLGEIASLEGSLRIGQRRFEAAARVLRRAEAGFREAVDGLGTVKVRIQLANLMQARERPADALEAFAAAASGLGGLGGQAPAYLAVTVVAGQVTALCDLGRAGEARQVLQANLDAFEADGAPHAGALMRFYEGRVALGLGELATAEERLGTATRVMLDLERGYDAALAAFYLAETLLARGRLTKLERLAGWLVQEFSRRQVAGELRKAVQLLARAAAARRVTTTLLAFLRRRIGSA